MEELGFGSRRFVSTVRLLHHTRTASHVRRVVNWQVKRRPRMKGELFDNHEWKRERFVEGEKQMQYQSSNYFKTLVSFASHYKIVH